MKAVADANQELRGVFTVDWNQPAPDASLRPLIPTQVVLALIELFHPAKGITLSILRQPLGASDFALEDYSYDDLSPGQKDPELKRFSIDHDRAYLIPILREALALNPNLKIMASPWSAPGWMKTSDSLIKGTLLPSSYAPLSRYFVKYIKAYEAAGIPIYAVTTGRAHTSTQFTGSAKAYFAYR